MARDLQVICYGMYIDQGKHLSFHLNSQANADFVRSLYNTRWPLRYQRQYHIRYTRI